MADVRCPMCGKSVTEEMDVCPFCQARLKPLVISSQGDEETTQSAEDSLREDYSEFGMDDGDDTAFIEQDENESIDSPVKMGSAEPENELPAWLLKLRSQTGQKEPVREYESPDQLEEKEQESLEFDLGGTFEESLDEPLDFPETIQVSVPMESVGEALPEDRDEEGTISEEKDAEEALPDDKIYKETSDWLSGLTQTAQEEEEKPAWFSSIKDLPQKEQVPAEPIDEIPQKGDDGWLDDIRDNAAEQEIEKVQDESPVEDSVYDEGIPDWMKDLQTDVDSRVSSSLSEEEDQPQSETEESPDWLTRLQAETTSTEISGESDESRPVEENIDWLGKMGAEIPSASDEVAPDSETPEWLRVLQEETQAFTEDTQPVETEHQADPHADQQLDSDTAEWMKDLHTTDSSEIGSDEKSGSEFPDWLTQNNLESRELIEEQSQPSTEIPDWLDNIVSETPEKSAQEISLPDSGTPDWIREIGSELQASANAESDPGDAGKLPFADTGMEQIGSGEIGDFTPDATEPDKGIYSDDEFELSQEYISQQLQPQSEEITSGSDLSGLPAPDLTNQLSDFESETSTPAEIPGWLRTLDADAETPISDEDEELAAGSNLDEISPAEIPSWVKEMQPVESLIADVEDSDKHLEEITETAGPLAGLPGVLPNNPGLGNLRKPLNYSIKLRVTEDQSLQAEQLNQMLGKEVQAGSTDKVDKKLPRRILRWVVAIMVLLVVSFPIISGVQNTSPLTNYPPELLAAREILIGIPPNSPVLLVFDYEPAYSGELEVAAGPILEDLLFSGARLALVSTSPSGPALAEHFLQITQGQQFYQNGMPYTNLGYLAGEAAGVLSFALNPSQTIPQALDGSYPWQSSLLFDVQSLADFKTVIILTDNSDTARIWIEQTGTILGETPLLMAISAQAEPMIRPYYDSRQIKGLVTGLAGGKAYEQTLQHSGLGQQYWDSFSFGLFLAELIIVISAIWSAVSFWRNRKSSLGKEA